jgi:hypothetical protein
MEGKQSRLTDEVVRPCIDSNSLAATDVGIRQLPDRFILLGFLPSNIQSDPLLLVLSRA